MNKYKLLIIICFFLLTLTLPKVTATVKNLNLIGKVIVLDAGHGGKDDGAVNSKIIERNNGFMIYIKESEKISDFLKILKAYNAVLYYEDIKAYREQKNLVNRLNNCEQANVEKTINSANSHISDIETIENTIRLDALDEKLRTTAIYRKRYKEVSLSELSKIISLETNTKVTKSGLNHRIRKIKEIASSLK